MSEIRTEFLPDRPRIAYDRAGSGSVVLFLHGIGGNRTNWREQLLACAEGFDAVAWDARGYGLSDDYEGPLDFSAFASDALRLLDHLGAKRAHFVGLSMGGRITQDFYFRHPDRVASMALCDSFAGLTPTLVPEQREEFIRLRKQPLLDGKEPKDIAEPLARTLVGSKVTAEHFQQLVDSIGALHKDAYVKTIEASMRYERVVDLNAINVPVQLIYGAEDRLTPPAIGEAMLAQISDSRLSIIDGAGHLSNIEKPEPFNRILLGFLREMEGA